MNTIYTSESVDFKLRRFLSEEEAYDKVPTLYFNVFLHDTDTKIGETDLRLKMDKRMYYYGHVGYSILEEFQGNHYALKVCELMKTVAKQDYNMKELIITCNPDNIASYKTIEGCGGVFLGVEDVPINHELYWKGEKKKAIFRIEL